MTSGRSLLETKLHVPKPRKGVVARRQLLERLERGAASRLTLLSAPAGFGKTTLLADWLASRTSAELSVGWLTLEEADDEPSIFWPYLITALQRAVPEISANALTVLASAQPPPINDILATVLNELAGTPHDVVLVLDDYQAVTASAIQAGMTYLLEHLPAQAHLIIATRADPALPLARLRARGDLVEIRASDLRFSPEAANHYLNEVMGLGLDAEDVAALEARTEGWIAALQLAALSMQGRDDPAGFIAGFAGDDRYVVDYLAEEVLQRQPDRTRAFLLRTSILDRLSGPLCDAVTGDRGGKAMLEALDRANLFLVSLDDRREWYRYHQLFADVLRAHLNQEEPDRLGELHGQASRWYERNGERHAAIRHALAGADFERAAGLVELALPSLRQARAVSTMHSWLQSLPEEVLAVRPVLQVTYAGLAMADGEVADVEARLRAVEALLAADGTAERVVVADDEAYRLLPATVAIYRAAQAQGAGDDATAMAHALQAIGSTRDDDHFERGAASGFLALGSWGHGELERAYGHWTDTMASLQRAGHTVDAIGCLRALAEIRIAQGRLRDATRLYERGLTMAGADGALVRRGAADMHVGMSAVLIEQDELDAARRHLDTSAELGDHAGLALNPYRWHLAMARIREVEGDIQGALELLDKAEALYVGEFYPDLRPITAIRARLWIAHGRLTEAMDWASERGLSVDDELSYRHEFEHLVLVRALLARSHQERDHQGTRRALAILTRLQAAAEAGERLGSLIQILVARAIAHDRLGERAAAQASLERGLTLAAPDGHVRVFADEGATLEALVADAGRRGIAPDLASRILRARANGGRAPRAGGSLIEGLTERELDVLRLLATDLDGPGIARELVVGVSTVRSHTKSIYAKLAVNNRRAAVRRGVELGLLRPASAA